MNCVLLAPCAMFTDTGALKFTLLLESATVRPPAGAGPDRLTVQFAESPDTMETGEHDREVTIGPGTRDKPAVRVTPLSNAVRVADWFEPMLPTIKGKDTVVAPKGTETDAGTVTTPVLLRTVTGNPPLKETGSEIVIVQVPVAPLPRMFGVQPNDFNVAKFRRIETEAQLAPLEAFMVAIWSPVRLVVPATKVAVVALCGTVTEAGTDSNVWSLESETASPPEGAACEIVTVHVVVALGPKAVGAQLNAVTPTGL